MLKNFRAFFLEEKQGKIKLSQRAVIFFFCLLISSFFWLLSALSEDYNRKLKIGIVYTGLSDAFVLTEDPLDHITIEVRGSGFELIGEQWSMDDEVLKVDLNSARKLLSDDRYYIPTNRLRNQLVRQIDPNLNLRFVSPDTLYFSSESRLKKTVPLKLELDLTFESAYNLRSEPVLNPESVLLSGPKSYIDTLSTFRLAPLQLKKLSDSVLQKISLKEGLPKGVKVEPVEVEVLIPVEKFTEKQLDLTLKVENQADLRSLKTFPDEVKVSFLVPLSKYEYLDTTVVNAKVIFKAADLNKSRLKIELENVPKYAKVLRLQPEQVEYIIRE